MKTEVDSLDDILVLHVEDGCDFFISITGNFDISSVGDNISSRGEDIGGGMTSGYEDSSAFDYSIKLFYLILSVLLGLLFYIFISYWIKAFKISDFKLKY